MLGFVDMRDIFKVRSKTRNDVNTGEDQHLIVVGTHSSDELSNLQHTDRREIEKGEELV